MSDSHNDNGRGRNNFIMRGTTVLHYIIYCINLRIQSIQNYFHCIRKKVSYLDLFKKINDTTFYLICSLIILCFAFCGAVILLSVLYCSVLYFCLGNILVIVIVAATKTFHSVTSVLIMNLAISDLLVGIGVMPFVALSIMNHGWVDLTVRHLRVFSNMVIRHVTPQH